MKFFINKSVLHMLIVVWFGMYNLHAAERIQPAMTIYPRLYFIPGYQGLVAADNTERAWYILELQKFLVQAQKYITVLNAQLEHTDLDAASVNTQVQQVSGIKRSRVSSVVSMIQKIFSSYTNSGVKNTPLLADCFLPKAAFCQPTLSHFFKDFEDLPLATQSECLHADIYAQDQKQFLYPPDRRSIKNIIRGAEIPNCISAINLKAMFAVLPMQKKTYPEHKDLYDAMYKGCALVRYLVRHLQYTSINIELFNLQGFKQTSHVIRFTYNPAKEIVEFHVDSLYKYQPLPESAFPIDPFYKKEPEWDVPACFAQADVSDVQYRIEPTGAFWNKILSLIN